VPLPVSAKGVRSEIVYCAGAVTDGMWSPVGVIVPPLLSTGPPLSVSPTKPEAPALKSCSVSSCGTLVAASEPPKVTWKPVLLKAPLPKPATVTVAPVGRIGASAAVIPAAE
jgi:hypothetical protein